MWAVTAVLDLAFAVFTGERALFVLADLGVNPYFWLIGKKDLNFPFFLPL